MPDYRIFKATNYYHAGADAHQFGIPALVGFSTPSFITYVRITGTNDGSYIGDKLWYTGHETPDSENLGTYVSSPTLALHFQAAFGTPPADHLEVCAFYATPPMSRRGSILVSHCWMGLGMDGKFRLFRGQPTFPNPTGDVLAIADTAIPGTYAGPWGPTNPLRADDTPGHLRTYVVYVKIHATDGEWHVWEEDVKLASFTGLDTLGASEHSTEIHAYSIGQRPPQPDLDNLGNLLPGSNPFVGSAQYQARYQHLVVADQVIGRCRVHTQLPAAVGFYDHWGTAVDQFARDSPFDKVTVVRDNTFDGAAYFPDLDATYIPSSGLFQTYTHAGLPALGATEYVIAVGVNNYAAAAIGSALPRGAIRPLLMIDPAHIELYLGEPRPLWEAYTADWPNLPNGHSGSGSDLDDFIGTEGFRFWQDWWTDPALLNVATVDAAEFGCSADTALEALLSQVTMLVVTAIPLCEGPPDNPYPPDPPDPGPLPLILKVEQVGQRRDVITPTAIASGVGVLTSGGRRIVRNMAVMQQGRLRPLAIGSDQFPEHPGPYPPHFDPCAILDEVTPIDVVPIPLVGRFFGISKAPLSVCGPIFTGTKEAIGGWTPGNLAIAASKGVKLMTAQGGTDQYLLNGVWNKDRFVAVTVAKLGPMLSTLQSFTASSDYIGHSMADDIAGDHFWDKSHQIPGDGIPHDELAVAVAELHAALPGIRLGIRARPSQFASNLGFDFYSAQWSGFRNGTPFAFGATEYAIAAVRDAFVSLDLNYVHGGDGSSGLVFIDGTLWSGNYECSAVEVIAYLTGMFNGAASVDPSAPKLIGSLGYKYVPEYLTRPGMIDALVTGRNVLAGIP